jgi:hypothetical protein
MSVKITYEPYDEKSLLVFGDRDTHQRTLNLLGGRWNTRKSGWILPISNKNKLDNFITTLSDLEDGVKTPTLRDHKVYHREDSASEDDEEKTTDDHDRKNAKYKYSKKDPMLYNKSVLPSTEIDENPYDYYRTFNKKPVDFKRDNGIYDSDNSNDLESSSEEESSSSDDFPSPGTPGKRSRYRKVPSQDYNELYHRVQDLQKRVSEMELQNSTKRRR